MAEQRAALPDHMGHKRVPSVGCSQIGPDRMEPTLHDLDGGRRTTHAIQTPKPMMHTQQWAHATT
eukprot:985719-Lingulodinium_polyedra.AAC.1